MTTKISQLPGAQAIASVSADNPITFNGRIGLSNPNTGSFTNVSANNIRVAAVTADSGIFKDISVSSLSLLTPLPATSGGSGFNSYTDGQLLIGNSLGTLSKNTLTAGTGISITNGNGAITIAATGNGSLNLLATVTANNSAAIEVTAAFLTSAYPIYEFEFVNILPATDNVSFQAQVSENNGSTYAAGTSYRYARFFANSATSAGSAGSGGSAAQIVFLTSAGNASSSGINGSAELYAPFDTSHWKSINHDTSYTTQATEFNLSTGAGSYKATTNAINAIKFYFSSGNIASGLIKIYGKS